MSVDLAHLRTHSR